MMKLLHERLREHGEEACIPFKGEGYSFALWNGEAKALADEIEKYYIPRPRFEDGEPIKEGDVFIQKFSDEEDVVTRVGVALYGNDGFSTVWFTNETVSRPTPKVLDADGVEIKVGDIVFFADGRYGDARFKVKGFGLSVGLESADDKTNKYIGCNTGLVTHDMLTHREPDSLERIRDYARSWHTRPDWNDGSLGAAVVEEIDNRLTALIERGA